MNGPTFVGMEEDYCPQLMGTVLPQGKRGDDKGIEFLTCHESLFGLEYQFIQRTGTERTLAHGDRLFGVQHPSSCPYFVLYPVTLLFTLGTEESREPRVSVPLQLVLGGERMNLSETQLLNRDIFTETKLHKT